MQPPSNPADTFPNVAQSQRRTSPCRAARGVVTEEQRLAPRAAYLSHNLGSGDAMRTALLAGNVLVEATVAHYGDRDDLINAARSGT